MRLIAIKTINLCPALVYMDGVYVYIYICVYMFVCTYWNERGENTTQSQRPLQLLRCTDCSLDTLLNSLRLSKAGKASAKNNMACWKWLQLQRETPYCKLLGGVRTVSKRISIEHVDENTHYKDTLLLISLRHTGRQKAPSQFAFMLIEASCWIKAKVYFSYLLKYAWHPCSNQ